MQFEQRLDTQGLHTCNIVVHAHFIQEEKAAEGLTEELVTGKGSDRPAPWVWQRNVVLYYLNIFVILNRNVNVMNCYVLFLHVLVP